MQSYLQLFFLCLFGALIVILAQYCSERILADHITETLENYKNKEVKRIIHDEHINKSGPFNWN